MQSSSSKDGDPSQNEDIKSAYEATREVLMSIEVRRMIDQLEASSLQGLAFKDAKNILLKQQMSSIKSRSAYLLSVKLPWWSYFRTPVWTLIFHINQKQLMRNQDVDPEELEKLDAILGRAEFSVHLSAATRNYLRQQIDNGEFSRWTALSMIRSFGCRTTKDGGIAPNPVGKFGMFFGSTSCLVLTTAFSIFVFTLSRELLQPCVRLCVIAGASQLLVLLGYLAALSLSLSWGRQRAARMLPRITGEEGFKP